ncbi:MAG TPA: hypothetical protein VIO14_12705 [Dehalococcoidia bacterium]
MSERSERPEKFDASRYLTRLQGKDYLEVKWRLLWLRTEHPDAAIETELYRLENDLAVFKAHVRIPGGGEATGWGHETSVDFGDFIEKAETKALGRALAALGYGTQFTSDFDFAEGNEEKVVDSPVSRPEGRGRNGSFPQRRDGLPATEPQVKAIYAIARGTYALDDAEIEERCRERYGVRPSELTRRQASEFIDSLKLGTALPGTGTAG